MNRSTQEFLQGVEIILSTQPNACLSAEHDVIYFGGYVPEDFTSKQLDELCKMGWYEEYDSRAPYV